MSAENAGSLEGDVASYVLAYLLQNNFKASANTFLQECHVLPSKTFIVLPETPLHVVISEHKAQLNAKLLVNTLGSEPAWQELWSKLQTTLSQIRCLSEDLNSHHFQPSAKIKVQKIGAETVKKSVHQSVKTSKSASMSPHKRKQGLCRRIQHSSPPHNVNVYATPPPAPTTSKDLATPNSPTMQHVLDTFLDNSFPGKLADIINQCVSSSDVCADEVSSDISSQTLERILNVTLSEPLLEGVFPITPTSQPLKSNSPLENDYFVHTSATTTVSNDLSGPSHKMPKLDHVTTSHAEPFPSEQEIDSFLDQIHQ